jgi:hypothetical protein
VSSSKRSSKWISSTSRTSKSSPPSREAQRSNTPRSMSTTTSYSSAPHFKGSGSHPQSHSSPVAPSRRLRPPGRREASRRQHPERRVRVAGVVALEPLGEDQLRLGERAEELGVEYLVAEAGVERLDPGVLPGRARLDVGGAGAGDEAPVAQGMGGETTPAPAGYPTLPDPTLIG